MDAFGRLTAEFEPASSVCTLLMPGWPNQPEIVPRSDSRDVITIEVSKCHPAEQWELILLRKGTLCPQVLTTGRVEGRPCRTEFDAVVSVPPGMVETLRVVTTREE